MRGLHAAVAVAAAALMLPAGARAEQAAPEHWIVPGASVSGPALTRALPPAPWTLSLTIRLRPRTTVAFDLGAAREAIVIRTSVDRVTTLRTRRAGMRLAHRRGWPDDGRHLLELAAGPPARLAVDGRAAPVQRVADGPLRIVARRGSARIEAMIATSATSPAGLLLQRLASLRLRSPPGRFPIGAADAGDRLHFGRDWTSGFWPGALWNGAALGSQDGLLARWALEATLANRGREHADTHDLGFIYGRSSLLAHARLCRGGEAPARICQALRRSALAAAGGLMALAASNRAAGLVPTRSAGREADVLIDSVMNMPILAWATRATGDPAYAEVASRHAHRLALLLVRADGSTAQAVHIRRSDGTPLHLHRHQGLSTASTWARGQSWALYGFAELGLDLGDAALVRVAERAAQFVAARLPAAGVPFYDYDAAPGAPVDVSAGVIAAAGLLRLDAACQALAESCAEPARWRSLARRLLDASLRFVSPRPPLGRLGSQVYSLVGRYRWEDHAELTLGVDYALEALVGVGAP